MKAQAQGDARDFWLRFQGKDVSAAAQIQLLNCSCQGIYLQSEDSKAIR